MCFVWVWSLQEEHFLLVQAEDVLLVQEELSLGAPLVVSWGTPSCLLELVSWGTPSCLFFCRAARFDPVSIFD